MIEVTYYYVLVDLNTHNTLYFDLTIKKTDSFTRTPRITRIREITRCHDFSSDLILYYILTVTSTDYIAHMDSYEHEYYYTPTTLS